MNRQEKRCPYYETPYKVNARQEHFYIAPPFIECSSRHKKFLDEECREWLALFSKEGEAYLD